MMLKINKISQIYQRNKLSQLHKTTYIWRETVHQQKIAEDVSLIDIVRGKVQ